MYFRMSAVAYLASYLSRAKFLSSALVASVIQRFGNILCLLLLITKLISMFHYEIKKLIEIDLTIFCWDFRLVDWCFSYCMLHDVDMNPQAHQVFYSGCQVSLLTFIWWVGKGGINVYFICAFDSAISLLPHLLFWLIIQWISWM